jgi:WD40 repeat protein
VDGRNLPKAIDASTVSFEPRRTSSDGKHELIVIEHEVEIRSLDGAGPPRVLEGHEAPVLSANFSVDGGRVVTASLDGTVRVWDADGGIMLVLRGSGSAIERASFGADGRSVVIMQGDDPTKAYEWPIETDALEQLAEAATTLCLPIAARIEYLDELPEPACQAFAACERAHGRAGDCSPSSPAALAPRAP